MFLKMDYNYFFAFKMKNKSETKVIYEVFISKILSERIEFSAQNHSNTFIFIKILKFINIMFNFLFSKN